MFFTDSNMLVRLCFSFSNSSFRIFFLRTCISNRNCLRYLSISLHYISIILLYALWILAIPFLWLYKSLIFYFFICNVLWASCLAIILSIVRLIDHCFVMWRVFAFIFYFAAFSFVDLNIREFLNLYRSVCITDTPLICKLSPILSYSCFMVAASALVLPVMLYTTSTLLSMSSYSSITLIFYVYILLKFTCKLSPNDIEYDYMLCYLIQNLPLNTNLVKLFYKLASLYKVTSDKISINGMVDFCDLVSST